MAMGCWTWPWSISTWRRVRHWWCCSVNATGHPCWKGATGLPGKGDQVLAGDVDGDGADDLVVLGISAEAGEGLEPGAGNDGAFVFINQSSPVTAVASRGGDDALDLCLSEPTTPTRLIQPRPFPLSVPAGR